MAKKPTVQRPGQITPTSGQYQIVGPKGRNTGIEITSVEGNRLPPTPKPGQSYVLVDIIKHKDGK